MLPGACCPQPLGTLGCFLPGHSPRPSPWNRLGIGGGKRRAWGGEFGQSICHLGEAAGAQLKLCLHSLGGSAVEMEGDTRPCCSLVPLAFPVGMAGHTVGLECTNAHAHRSRFQFGLVEVLS